MFRFLLRNLETTPRKIRFADHGNQNMCKVRLCTSNRVFSVGDLLQGSHLFPFRTEKLSPVKPMIVLMAKVGCRQHQVLDFHTFFIFLYLMLQYSDDLGF